MSWSHRRLSFVCFVLIALLGLALLGPLPAFEGRAALGKDIEIVDEIKPIDPTMKEGATTPGSLDNGALVLNRDGSLKRLLEAAIQAKESENWRTAYETLQKLVDMDPGRDTFAEVPRVKDGRTSLVSVSVQTEADRLLGSLPKEAKDLYRAKFGGEAATKLKEAREERDMDKLKEVIRRFRHTDAGLEAATMWATHVLDRGKYIEAAREFESLLDSEGWDKVAPLTLFKAAFAFRQAANQSSDTRASLLAKEDKAWESLRDRGIKELNLGNEMLTLSDLQDFIAKLPAEAAPRNQLEHALVGVNVSRSGQAVGGPAYLKERWKQPMFRSSTGQGKVKLTSAKTALEQKGQPVLAPFQPVAVVAPIKKTTKDKDGNIIEERIVKTPVLVFRSFYGLQAVDMKTGRIVWESPSAWSLEGMAGGGTRPTKAGSVQALESWSQFYMNTVQKPSILLENSTVGTLSTDGNLVFAVEDFQVPPTPQMPQEDPWGRVQPNQVNFSEDVKKAIAGNRIQAIKASTGGLRWELGGPTDKNGLSDTFFLGPPLPYEGKLYLLVEKSKKLQLLCLETYTEKKKEVLEDGKEVERELDRVRIVSRQPLGDAKYPMVEDSLRRAQVTHLAISDGILVCPTNAGAMLAFNLRTNRLVWAYFYREKGDGPEEWDIGMGMNRPVRPGWRRMPDGTLAPMMINTSQQWKVTPPVISDGKVVFTAPDGRTLNCLDLKDGTRLWTRYRGEDDFFLGGVYDGKVLVVGKKKVRGLNLKNGDTMWSVDAGMPSGMGIASENVYYLPLASSAQTREPAIAAIDVHRGILIGETRSRNKDVPGNLVFFDNSVLSQSAMEVIAYPQLKAQLAIVDEQVAKDPKNMQLLYDRGLLRLEKGDLLGSVEDLRKVIAEKPGKALEEQAREKLYVTLTEFMLRDFDRAETFLKEYEELCKPNTDGADDARKAELAQEERRRRVKFLCLVARGKEQQGKLLEAFEKYQECGALVDTTELFTVPDEPTVKAAADVLAQGRIAAMVASATPEARKPLEDRIAQKWDEIKKSNDLNELRKFVAVFGSLFAVGKEARLQLAEKLMDDERPEALIEAERHLSLLRGRDESADLKARAVEMMARLCARKGLMEDAMYFYRMLGHDYPKVMIRDGKTGADMLRSKSMEKPFVPYLEEPSRANRIGKIYSSTADGQRGNWQLPNATYRFEHQGEPLPFFKRHSVGLTLSNHHLHIEDHLNGAEYWDTALKYTYFSNLSGAPADAARFPYQTMGHLVVMQVGNLVFGIDPVNKQVRWSFDMQTTPGATGQLVRDPADGSIQMVYTDGYKQRLGSTGPLDGNAICVQTREGLVALDPISGRTLWTRSDIGPRNHLFGDEKTIFMVEMDSGGVAVASRALRAYDGVTVKLRDFSDKYQHRLRIDGEKLLYSDTVGARPTVHLYDMMTGKDLWSHAFPVGATLMKSEDPDLVGAIENGSRVRVMSVRDRKEAFTANVEGTAVANAVSVRLLRDAGFYYVAVQGTADPDVPTTNGFQGVQPNLMTNIGMRSVPVNGHIYCFKPDGTRNWEDDVKNEMLVLDQFHDMPIIFFTSRYTKVQGNPRMGMGSQQQVVVARARDKRTGRLLFDSDLARSFHDAQNFHTLAIDAANRKIEFTCPTVKLVFAYDLPKDEKKVEEKK
jgi:outer membrane protein assembly factor BamB